MVDSKLIPRPDTCVYCAIVTGARTPEVVAYRGRHTAVFPSLHQQPRNRGHVLVVSVQHVVNLYDVEEPLAGAMMSTLAKVCRAVKSAWAADGISVRQNNDVHGGQDVFHLHFHVIPRFANDGFILGEDRYPFGVVEVGLEERVQQATRLREHLVRLNSPMVSK